MTRELTKSIFDDVTRMAKLDRFAIGFDDIFRRLSNFETVTRSMVDTYPPFNLKKIEENKYVIEMAVAGFSKDELAVSLKERTLTISGNTPEGGPEDSEFLWRGIASRSFTKTFTLADTVEVKDADLDNGVLRIHLENLVPPEETPKQIKIKV